MMGSYRDVALSEKIQFRQSIIETKNFIMLSSTCLYIACSFCSALHRLQVWKAVFGRYCNSGLKWCWSTLAENNERLPLTSASFSLGLQGRELRHETSLIHPNALTQIALADSSVMESRICTSECHLIQTCFAACEYTVGRQVCQGTAKFGRAAKIECRRWESWCPAQEGLKFSGSLARGRVLVGSCQESQCLFGRQLLPGPADLCNPWFGKGGSTSLILLCCTSFDYSPLCNFEVELDQ